MTAEIIIIGDEILLGLITDTNSGYIARRLAEFGITIRRITKVGDNIDLISESLEDAGRESELVITCGGLGPTHDDMTRDGVAKFLNVPLEQNDQALDEILAIYKKAGRTMGESNRMQAMIPRGAAYLSNQRGTAPGLYFTQGSTTYFCLQGVPKEMEWMTETYIVPHVKALNSDTTVIYRILRTTGVPESVLYDKLKDVVQKHRKYLDIAFLPKLTVGVDIRLTCSGKAKKETQALLFAAENEFLENIHSHFPLAVYGFQQDTLEEVVAGLFIRSGSTIATAESCTGGLIAHRLTNVSGSSAYFSQGMTLYSNASKVSRLNVPEDLISAHGAVSEAVAAAMAENIRTIAGTSIGLSSTGIAGPTGGTETKPVGMAYLALATAESTKVHRFMPLPFAIERIAFKERLSQFALDVLRKYLLTLSP